MSWLNLSTSLMKTPFRGLALGLMLPLWCNPMVRGADRTPGHTSENKTGDVLLSTMQHELQRATTKLGGLDPAPYFVSYSVYDQDGTVVVGGLGSLLNSTEFHRRTGQVTNSFTAFGFQFDVVFRQFAKHFECMGIVTVLYELSDHLFLQAPVARLPVGNAKQLVDLGEIR